MGVRIKVASRPAEIMEVFRLRHRVFVEERGYLPAQGGMLFDAFDALPTTANFMAVLDGRVIGALRITADSDAGMPADAFFDFRSVLPPGAKAASCSLLCVADPHRSEPRCLSSLMGLAGYWVTRHGLTHICAPVNPLITRMLENAGFTRCAKPFRDPKGLPTQPMLIDTASFPAPYVRFIARQPRGPWPETFERGYFEAGELIVSADDPTDEVHLVVDGRVEALDKRGRPVATFRPGERFGQVPRSGIATVRATAPTELQILGPDAAR